MAFNRTFLVFFVLTAALLGYGVGYWHGGLSMSAATGENPMDASAPQVADSEVGRANSSEGDSYDIFEHSAELAALLQAGAWFQVESWLVAQGDRLSALEGPQLRSAISANLNKYDALAMRRVLSAYLAVVGDDVQSWLLLSDLQQMSGLRESALETLFEVLNLALDVPMAERVRREARQIIQVVDAQLQARGAIAEREAFWRYVSQRDPYSDYYRLQWARSLAGGKSYQQARRVLLETGTTDIRQADIDELLARIEIADQGLQFERQGDRLLANAATLTGATLTLLVDTGANVTSLSKAALRQSAAIALGEKARLRTANGIVSTGIFRVPQLEVQGRVFKDVRVVELPVELPGLDGLLGLDLLNQLKRDPLGLDS